MDELELEFLRRLAEDERVSMNPANMRRRSRRQNRRTIASAASAVESVASSQEQMMSAADQTTEVVQSLMSASVREFQTTSDELTEANGAKRIKTSHVL